MTTVDLRGRFTLTVPEAGHLVGLGRDAAYAAAERDELPAIRVGRRLVVPTHRLLDEVLGMPGDLIARALGLDPEHTEAGPASPATATNVSVLTKEQGHCHGEPQPAP